MKRCTRCVMPETWAGITFDNHGICSLCREHEEMKIIDWDARMKILDNLLNIYTKRAMERGNKYDCIVGYSGGKDTAYTLWAMKEKYGMQPLAVTFDHGFTLSPEGEYNLQEIPKILDVDHLRFSVGNKLRNALCRKASEVMGDFCWHCHNGIGAFPARVSKAFDIPLQIWGEPTASYQTFGEYSLADIEEQNEDHFKRVFQCGFTSDKMRPSDYLPRDMMPFEWPDGEFELKAIYLGNYEPWDQREHVKIIKEHLGWKSRSSSNTYVDWDKVDCSFEVIRDWQKFMRRGFGKATFQASKDIRDGLISREDALELIEKYEGNRPWEMDLFEKETGISREEFERITSRKI